MKNLLFNFADMGGNKDRVTKSIVRTFQRAGASVIQVHLPSNVKRTSGITYREMSLSFADGQVVAFLVKQTGDIFQVKLNGKLFPIKEQEDQARAIGEIARAMNASRAKFQAALAKTRVMLPSGIRTAAPRMEVALQEKIKSLDEAIELVNEEIAALD